MSATKLQRDRSQRTGILQNGVKYKLQKPVYFSGKISNAPHVQVVPIANYTSVTSLMIDFSENDSVTTEERLNIVQAKRAFGGSGTISILVVMN